MKVYIHFQNGTQSIKYHSVITMFSTLIICDINILYGNLTEVLIPGTQASSFTQSRTPFQLCGRNFQSTELPVL